MKKLLAGVAALLALWSLLEPRRRAPRPDVVIALVDTLRRDRLPFHGYDKDTAPFLSRLASGGVVFEHAYSTSSWTAPATASLFTSLYPFQHGVVYGRGAVEEMRGKGMNVRLNRIPRAAKTIPEALKRAGYFTCGISQNINVSAEQGFGQGFDELHLLSRLNAVEILAKLDELRPRLLARRPYFLYLHFMDVHAPYEERPPLFDPALTGDQRTVSAYDSQIRHFDAHLERAYSTFRWDDALFVFTADHGEELGDHGRWGHAETLYAEVLNVPFFLRGPGLPAGRRVLERVSHVDLLPTLRDLLGLPSGQDSGTSLAPLLRGEETLPARALFADLSPKPKTARLLRLTATLKGGWKLIDGARAGPMLFHLDHDPLDLRNRVEEQPQLARELRRAFRRYESRARRLPPEFSTLFQDLETNEELRALGYVQ